MSCKSASLLFVTHVFIEVNTTWFVYKVAQLWLHAEHTGYLRGQRTAAVKVPRLFVETQQIVECIICFCLYTEFQQAVGHEQYYLQSTQSFVPHGPTWVQSCFCLHNWTDMQIMVSPTVAVAKCCTVSCRSTSSWWACTAWLHVKQCCWQRSWAFKTSRLCKKCSQHLLAAQRC